MSLRSLEDVTVNHLGTNRKGGSGEREGGGKHREKKGEEKEEKMMPGCWQLFFQGFRDEVVPLGLP